MVFCFSGKLLPQDPEAEEFAKGPLDYTAFHFNFYEILLLVKWVVRRFAKSFKNFLNRLEFCAVNNLRRAD